MVCGADASADNLSRDSWALVLYVFVLAVLSSTGSGLSSPYLTLPACKISTYSAPMYMHISLWDDDGNYEVQPNSPQVFLLDTLN